MSHPAAKKYINTEKISLCRSFWGQTLKERGYSIYGLNPCRFGASCKEAHSWEELRCKKHIRDWYTTMDKSSIDLLALRTNIISIVEQSRDSIKDKKYSSVVHSLHKMSLPELLQFTYDIICFHRKIAKNLPSKRTQGSIVPDIGEGGYRYKEDVPKFELENEDIFWSLERSLHPCSTHMTMFQNKDKVHQASAICCGDVNCKFGEHDISKIACVEDMMTGKCSCLTIQQILDRKKQIELELLDLKKQIENSVDSEGFQIKITTRVRTEISQKIKALQEAFGRLPVRSIHYTEQGMVPFNTRFEEQQKTVQKEIDISKLEISTTIRKVKKPILD